MHKVMYQFHLKLTCSFRLGQARYKPCSRSPPSRRARRSAERGDRQGLFLNWAGGFSGFLQSIRPTEEFEGQNNSIKSRVRSTLLIWDTFSFDRVVDVSARVLLRLSPHASLYPSHLPYLFLRQMRYLPWKHKMLKMSTREQCQYSLFAEVLSGGKKAEYFERLRWECPLRYEEGLSIFAGLPSTLKKWYVVSGKLMLRVKITDKLYPRRSSS
ncbi:hypothetical protein ACFX2C_041617 [Malus domestica]